MAAMSLIVMSMLSLGASQIQINAFADDRDDIDTTPMPIVQPPRDVVCALLPQLGEGAYLKTEPWSFMRTIYLRSTLPLYDLSNEVVLGVGGGATTAVPTINPIDQLSYSSTFAPGDQLYATITAKFWAWTTEYEMTAQRFGKSASRIVNPAAFWDTTQEIYDCKGVKLGSVTSDFNMRNLFLNRYNDHKILDANGNHVADLAQQEQQSNDFFASRQYMIYLKNREGIPIAGMRHASDGWHLGPWFENFQVDIEFLSANVQAPPPAMEPEFITLVFASQLGMNNRFGPYWSFIMPCIIAFLLLVCCICACCNCAKAREQAGKAAGHGGHGEQESLMGHGGTKKGEDKARSMFNCCSRKTQETYNQGSVSMQTELHRLT
jgi:hypothetical protein